MSGYVIRQLTQRGGTDDLAIRMIIEEGDLIEEDRGTDPVIILESTETGTRLWRWAQRECRAFPFSLPAFGQPAGIRALRLKGFTQVAQQSKNGPIPKDHCIVGINGTMVIVPNTDLYVVVVSV